MANLQKELLQFHNDIKLRAYEENESLRNKRDLLINELTEALKDEKVPETDKSLTFKKFDQGSYAMNTGIKPKDDDYDIDVGIIFDIKNDEYDSNKLKKLVFDKLDNQHNRTVEFNRPCITVKYSDGYHFDLAIYADNQGDLHIAWGKEHSQINRCWYKSEPKKLTQWVSDVSTTSEESEQFRRCVRYLKKWKEKHFSSNGNNTPPSIGLTIQARNSFYNTNGYRKDKDLEALINIVTEMKGEFSDTYDSDTSEFKKFICIELPVEPYKDVYYKMSLIQRDNFFQKTESLLEALKAAKDEESDYQSSKVLRKVFGDKFPLTEDAKRSNKKPFIPTGQNA